MTSLDWMVGGEEEGTGRAGFLTGLWECCEMLGGYLGSTFGGVAADTWGFQAGTAPVIAVQAAELLVLGALAFFICWVKRTRVKA